MAPADPRTVVTNDRGDTVYGGPHIVSDVMTRAVVAVGRAAGFKEIVRLMQQWRVGALPVVEDGGLGRRGGLRGRSAAQGGVP